MPDRPIVFVTGASAGIGAASARRLAEAGHRLILTARSEDAVHTLADALNAAHGDGTAVARRLDVTDPQAHLDVVAGLPDDWRAVDVALLNAGLALNMVPVWENTPEEVDRMMDTNVKGVLNGLRALIPGMLARGRGHVITIGSTAGHTVYAGGVVYCASKHALLALTEGLKVDLHGTPIRVSAVSPGMVETEFSRVRFDGDDDRAEAVYEDTTPLTAEDIAEAVAYCVEAPPHVNVAEVLVTPRVQSGYTMIARGPEHARDA